MIGFLPLGGAREVGASCGVLTIGDARILVDAGMRPAARPGQSRTPDLERLAANPPDAIIITHAHIDHTGCLPLVAGMFPDAPIFATDSTIALARILLQDSARIMASEQLEREGETPLYDDAMVEETLRRMRPVGFDQPFAPVAGAPALSARYLRAGHILGAGMVLFESPHGRVLHTGDISTGDHRTIKGVDLQRVPPADLMICEGTYGNRAHHSRKEQERALVEMVQSVVDKGGRVLIPAFAVGRAQEVILILKSFRATGLISPIKMFVDGMCKSVCAAYEQQSHDLHPALQNFLRNSQRPLFMDPSLGVHAVGPRMRRDVIERGEPGLIISTSGMLSGGPAPLYAAKLAESERNAIIFTGYQDEESPGAALLRAAQGDTLSIPGGTIRLNCQVARYGLSGHADAAQIEQVVRLCGPRHLVLVHGDEAALGALAARFRNIAVHVPAAGEEIVLGAAQGLAARPSAAPARVDSPSGDLAGAPALSAPPTAEALWAAVAARQLPARPWTAIELGQCFYGAAYQPA
ncbi:MAG TPA: MBL fold metallo-hydrolase, partial [Herpetosiphonaceae bacterium]